ncbi:MAG TPA: transposase, partial [Gammaproteobacteria bacterium]|nr:transposase [Gammaproteobacteria bacterium]
KTVLVRDASLMKPAQQKRLSSVLTHFQTLRVVYQLRMKLQDIWNLSAASPKELIEALQEWCQQAEATRIEPLMRFVRHLKTYTIASSLS